MAISLFSSSWATLALEAADSVRLRKKQQQQQTNCEQNREMKRSQQVCR